MAKKILLVDDEDLVIASTKDFLEYHLPGCQVDGIFNFQAGLAMARSAMIHDYAVVLLDGEINGQGGYKIAEALRANGYQGIIISVTGKPFATAVPPDKARFFDEHYEKPADYGAIAGVIAARWQAEQLGQS